MKLIFASGQEVDLRGAHFMDLGEQVHNFYDKKDEGRRWLYSVSATAHFVVVANAPDNTLTKDSALEYVATNIYDYTDDRHLSDLRVIRSVLMRDFSARRGWKTLTEESEEDTP